MRFLKSLILFNVLMFSAPAIMAAEADPKSWPTTGTVAETMIAGGYLYMLIEEQGVWIATSPLPQPVSVGEKVEYGGGMEMKGFYSRALDRTFDSIYLIQNVSLAGQSADAAATKVQENKAIDIPKPATVTAPVAGDIAPLKEGKTIAVIVAEAASLNEQKVSLNAKVIKVSKNIMGKNWITLQDGTGTEPDNKLLATSLELVSPGDMVIASGVVRTDIDIGSGYTYKVLLEEAAFSPGFE